MKTNWRIVLSIIAIGCAPASAWELPPDNGTMGQEAVKEILSKNDYPETSSFKQSIDFIDFSANGHTFTQTVVTLTPDKPLIRNGKKIVVVGGEPGSEYAMDFVITVEGKEGAAVWLAKRGITFVAPTRVGRWNFLAPSNDGSWETVPIGQRMPVFNRDQKSHWPETDYIVKESGVPGGPYRFPKEGTALYKYMLAATPQVFLDGYRLALQKAIPDRNQSLVLFWGMSTGGSSLYPLAKSYTPDGYLNWGTSPLGLAALFNRTVNKNYNDIYDHSALRVRERGPGDFDVYTKEVDPATKAKWWQASLKNPRFKSTEDPPMQFGAAALTEIAMRLWHSDFLPQESRQRGLAAFVQDMFEPTYPPTELKKVPVLELNGTKDEVLPPPTVDANRKVTEFYTKKLRVGRIEGLHHYLFTQDSIKTVGSVWMKFLESGYFD
jgi:hypothetical protein